MDPDLRRALDRMDAVLKQGRKAVFAASCALSINAGNCLSSAIDCWAKDSKPDGWLAAFSGCVSGYLGWLLWTVCRRQSHLKRLRRDVERYALADNETQAEAYMDQLMAHFADIEKL